MQQLFLDTMFKVLQSNLLIPQTDLLFTLSIAYFPWGSWLLWNSLLPAFTNLLLSMGVLTEFLSPFHFSVEPLCLSCKWLMREEKLIYVKGNVTAYKPEVFVTIPIPLPQPENVGYRTLLFYS